MCEIIVDSMIVSCIMSISKILTGLCAIDQKNKKQICRYCLECCSCKKVLVMHKEVCLKINGKQRVKLRNESIKSGQLNPIIILSN